MVPSNDDDVKWSDRRSSQRHAITLRVDYKRMNTFFADYAKNISKGGTFMLSAHKIGGAKGVGALVRAGEHIHFADPLIRGGGQERGLRAGTENVAGIAAFGAAAAAARRQLAEEAAHMLALRTLVEEGLRAISPQALILGAAAERLPNTTLFALEGMKAETAIIALDLEGVAVSAGAACSSGKVRSSHVLAAMGVSPALGRAAVRVSLGWTTTQADIERFLNAWRKLAGALSKGSKEQRGIAA